MISNNQILPKKLKDIRTEEGQEKILITCALRFDGYQYLEDTGFDPKWVYREYFKTKKWDLSLHEKMAAFFMLQRQLCKWALIYEPFYGNYWWAFRSLFVEVADKEVPEKYWDDRYLEPWEKYFKPHVQEYTDYIKELTDSMTVPIESLGKIKIRLSLLKDLEKTDFKENERLTLSWINDNDSPLFVKDCDYKLIGRLPKKYKKILMEPISNGWMVVSGRSLKTTSRKTLPIELAVSLTTVGKYKLQVAQKNDFPDTDQQALLNAVNTFQ